MSRAKKQQTTTAKIATLEAKRKELLAGYDRATKELAAIKPPTVYTPVYSTRAPFEGDMPLAERVRLANACAALLKAGTYPGNDHQVDTEPLYTASTFLACVVEEVDSYFAECHQPGDLPAWESKRKYIPGRERDHAPTDGEA